MITKALLAKAVVVSAAVLLLCVLSWTGSIYAADKPFVLGQYPALKFGFTSQNLAKWLPNSVDNLKKVIDFASRKGFSFIELRDANVGLSYDDAKKIAAYARKKKIEVIYAMGIGGLDANYFELLAKGLANTRLFDGPRFMRTAAPGKEFTDDPKKQFWTAAEFTQLVENLNRAGNLAAMFGYTIYVENAFEGLKGDGTNTFGTADLFGPKGVNSNVGFQLDTANFFCTSRADNAPADVKAYFEGAVKRMGYTHLKTSIDKKPAQVLNGNAVPFETFLAALAHNGKVYVAFELANADSLENAYANHQKSIDYLRKNFSKK